MTHLNSLAHRSAMADGLIFSLATNNLLKGGVFITVFWWAWFRKSAPRTEPRSQDPRETLLYSMLVCVPAVVISRLMAVGLPFRQRPINNLALHLRQAFTFDPNAVAMWNSFPSDHAVLFCALATGLYLVSRRIGWLMYIYAAIFILLPRIYLGLHYPSDILAGALLGMAAVWTIRIVPLRRVLGGGALHLMEHSPGLFYACLFQLTYQTANLYDPFLGVARVAIAVARTTIHRL